MTDIAPFRAATPDMSAPAKVSGGAREAAGSAHLRVVDCDVCVVGDDVAGLGIAIDLARRGRDVVLLTFPGGAVQPLDGVLAPGFALPTAELVERVGMADAQELLILSAHAAETGLGFAHRAGVEVGPRGRLRVARPHAAEALYREQDLRQQLAPDTTVLVEGEDLAALLGTSTFAAGLGVVPAERVSARAIRVALEEAALEAGVRAIPVTGALAADLQGLRKYLTTDKRRIRAFQVVVSGHDAFARLGARVTPLPRAPWVTAAFRLPGQEVPYSGMVEETGLTGLRFHADGGKLAIAMATATRVMTRVGAARVARRHTSEIYSLGSSLVEGATGRMLAETPGMPRVFEGERGVWYALASAGDEITHGFLAGRLISGAIGDKDDRIALLQPFAGPVLGGWAGRVARFAGYWHVRLAARLHSERLAALVAPEPASDPAETQADTDAAGADLLPAREPRRPVAAVPPSGGRARGGMAGAAAAVRHAVQAALHAASGWASGIAARAATASSRRRRPRREEDHDEGSVQRR